MDTSQVPSKQSSVTIHIIRHGQSLHNVHRGYPYRDPPLTQKGEDDAKHIEIPSTTDGNLPDIVLISPMNRTIQTAILAFPGIFQTYPYKADVQIWPELREAHDAICNQGISRVDLIDKFPGFDFSECPLEWDHPPHTTEGASARAEAVRKRLKDISKMARHHNIALITHRGFIAFLVQGSRFDVCETRSYRFATTREVEDDAIRFGTNIDTKERQDFGPTLLIPVSANESSNIMTV